MAPNEKRYSSILPLDQGGVNSSQMDKTQQHFPGNSAVTRFPFPTVVLAIVYAVSGIASGQTNERPCALEAMFPVGIDNGSCGHFGRLL
jgi:hypothetical protein